MFCQLVACVSGVKEYCQGSCSAGCSDTEMTRCGRCVLCVMLTLNICNMRDFFTLLNCCLLPFPLPLFLSPLLLSGSFLSLSFPCLPSPSFSSSSWPLFLSLTYLPSLSLSLSLSLSSHVRSTRYPHTKQGWMLRIGQDYWQRELCCRQACHTPSNKDEGEQGQGDRQIDSHSTSLPYQTKS